MLNINSRLWEGCRSIIHNHVTGAHMGPDSYHAQLFNETVANRISQLSYDLIVWIERCQGIQ